MAGTSYEVKTVTVATGVASTTTYEALRDVSGDLTMARALTVIPGGVASTGQVGKLFSAPVTLVPGVSGKIIDVVQVTARIAYGSAAYTGANAMEIRYTDGSGVKVTSDIPTSFLNATANQIYSAIDAAGVATVGAPVVICVPVADPGAGDSPIYVETWYRVRGITS